MQYYSIRENAEHTTNGLSFAYYPVDPYSPKYHMMHHWHKEFELVLVRRGSLSLKLNNTPITLQEGEFTVISPGVIHGGQARDAVYECLVFSVDALRYDKANTRVLPKHIRVGYTYGAHTENLKPYVLGAFEAVKSNAPRYELRFYANILSLFATILENGLYTESGKRKHEFSAFENVLKYIEENYRSNITLEDMAKTASLSKKYFSEYFKKITGQTPFAYLIGYRLEQACQMLIETELSVTQIALDCGFNDISYFIKSFKAEKGMTPAKYRKAFT